MRIALVNDIRLPICKRVGIKRNFASMLASGTLGLLMVAASSPAKAIISTQNFTTTETFTDFAPNSANTIFFFPFPQFTVQPFDTSLGTLISTTIAWATTASFNGTIGTAAESGFANFSFNGTYFVDNLNYFGSNSSAGNGGTQGNPLTVNVPAYGATTLLLTAEAGIKYNPNLLVAFQGPNSFSLTYRNTTNPDGSPYSFSFTNIESGNATIATTASVTYDYVPVPGPLPLLGAGAAWGWSRKLRRRCTTGSR